MQKKTFSTHWESQNDVSLTIPEALNGKFCSIVIDATSPVVVLDMGNVWHGKCEATVTIQKQIIEDVALPLENGRLAQDYLDDVQANPRRRAALERARKRAATDPVSRLSPLARLRQHAGMSQNDVAKAMGCAQSFIAKLERSSETTDIRFGTMDALARAIGCDIHAVVNAVSEQRNPLPNHTNSELSHVSA